MEAGETHEAGRPVFPPVPETIIGALRTAILAQRGIDPSRLKALGEDEDLDAQNLPLWGTPRKSGFYVAGPLLKANGVVLFPAPASWFYRTSEEDTGVAGTGRRAWPLKTSNSEKEAFPRNKLCVYEARPAESPPVKLPKPWVLWVENPPEDMEPLSGKFWLTRKALENESSFELRVICDLSELSEDQALAVPVHLLVKTEERVGIARDNLCRAVKTGHLYAARHLRLVQGVSLLVGLDKPLCPSHLDERGIFQLGGEGRMVRYRLLDEGEVPRLPGTRRGRFLTISPLAYYRAQKAGLLTKPYASGKLFRVAGWDMKTAFHKPTKSYFPVGAVFFTNKDQDLCEMIPF